MDLYIFVYDLIKFELYTRTLWIETSTENPFKLPIKEIYKDISLLNTAIYGDRDNIH